jgi:peptide/nickel transport system substrate-binding protein
MLLAAMAATILSTSADARSITWARAQDAPTLDPHAFDEGISLSLNQQIYEPLLIRDAQGKTLPALAESWTLTNDPLVWEFRLRRGVTFHDGTPFTADDVAFSIGRARHANSGVAHLLASIDQVVQVESHVVRVRTRGPTPLLPAGLTHVLVMSKAWSEKNGAAQVADRAGRARAHTFRNANGTGPFVLVSREIGQRTVMRRNDTYWGRSQSPVEIAELIYRPIPNDSERVQALVSGDVDLVQDVPVNELPRLQANKALSITTGPLNRTVFLGLNVGEKPLASSDVKDKNPLADRRVREAINTAISRQMIQRNALLGQAIPTGTVAPPSINGYPRQQDRLPQPDIARARVLLAEAGWPNGFSLKLDCPRQAWGRSEAICDSVASQLKSVGITVASAEWPFDVHMEQLRAEPPRSDFFLLSLEVPSFDSEQILNNLFHSRTKGAGRLNATRFSNAEVDKLIGSLAGQLDFTARGQAIAQVWRVVQEETVYVPLHVQTIAYAMKADLTVGVDIENQPKLRFARIKAAQ